MISLFAVAGLFGQADGDYRTTGNATFAASTFWQRYNGSAWVAAVAAPSQSDNVITIRSGHTATLTASKTLDQLVVESGGIVTLNSGTTLTLSNGTGFDLNVDGTVNNSGSISIDAGAVVNFNSGSTYNHARNGGTIPTATWDVASNCNITGVTTTAPGGSNQTFGNVLWNCASQSQDVFLANINIDGDLTIQNTNGREGRPTAGAAHSVGGNYYHNGGIVRWTRNVNGSLSVTGNVIISGGDCRLSNGTGVGSLNLNGDLTITGGTLTEEGSASGIVNFNRSGTQTYLRTGGTISQIINFVVSSGSVLDVGTSIISGSGTFNLNSGAGIITAHPQGLSTTAGTGSIQVTGTRTYSSGADYTYNGSALQVSGNGLTGSRNLTINNNAGVNLSGNTSVSGTLTMVTGNISTGAFSLSLTNTSAASLNHTVGTRIIGRFQRGVNSPGDYLFPIGTETNYRPATFNFSTLSSATNITVEFIEATPGLFTPYADDVTNQLDYAFTDGYWHFSSTSLPTNTYSLSLDGSGFSSYSIDGNSRISGRNAGSTTWQDFGTHGSVAGSIITRTGITNLNTTSFDYCFAGRCNLTANAGSDVEICKGGSTTLNGSGGGTYSWSPSYGLSATNIANPVASPEVTTTYTLTVTGAGCTRTDDVIVTVNPLPAAALGYAYQKTITIDHNRVSGGTDLVNFPVLINISSSPQRDELRFVTNGGHVENLSGWDIIFTDANYNRLDHQIVSYTATNGNLVAWVRIPVLSASVNTSILMLYGNPQVTVNPSSSATWSSEYVQVMHLDGDFADATQYGNSGVNTETSDVPGKILNGRGFDGVNDRITVADNPDLDLTNEESTFSLWINWVDASNGAFQRVMSSSNTFSGGLPNGGYEWASQPGGNHFFYPNGIDGANYNLGPNPFINNTWQHLAVTLNYSTKAVKIYVNGVPNGFFY